MYYVLLLRGVNVGGKHKVVMSELKNSLKSLDYHRVSSYINSGNLFFYSEKDKKILRNEVTIFLQSTYEFPIPFALYEREELLNQNLNLPDWWQADFARKDVLFYTNDDQKMAMQDFVEEIELNEEAVYIGEYATFWAKQNEASFLKTAYHQKLLKTPLYPHITIRNGKTYTKIIQLLNED
ncbi:DUF1697 domain-containing protein [Facklamia lactis]|uniref:DUF1697 domain-containing protein n=1 Tax=Facklamia lactis TaxID=2749967 RepID=UPI0018CCE35C|nr:DUF1697 domain-containing protein [Facklamia lactis]MBG9980338.1 DUF1697 domain-containing protein [Facklamia lactis]